MLIWLSKYKLNNIVKNKSELLDKVFNGKVAFVPPLLSNNESNDTNVINGASLMYFLFPIEDIEHNVIAAVVQEIDPAFGFSEILQLSHVGESGESYIFNREGRMLSTSRFENELNWKIRIKKINPNPVKNAPIRNAICLFCSSICPV